MQDAELLFAKDFVVGLVLLYKSKELDKNGRSVLRSLKSDPFS